MASQLQENERIDYHLLTSETLVVSTHYFYLDNIRSFSIIVVICLHAAISLLEFNDLGVLKTISTSTWEILALGWFVAISQIVTMGIMFFVAGFFTPASFDNKGAGLFLKDRLIRLGIPLIVFDLFIFPIMAYLRQSVIQGSEISFSGFIHDYSSFNNGLGAGPIWFIEHLLIFSLIYALWRSVFHQPVERGERKVPGGREIVRFILVIAIITLVVRIIFPINWKNFFNLKIAYIPLYLSIFAAGILSWRSQWLNRWTDSFGGKWLKIGFAFMLIFPLFLLIGAGERIQGGLRPVAFGFAFWETIITISLSLGLVIVFRRYWNSQNKYLMFLTENSYAAYFIHVPIIFGLHLLSWNWNIGLFAKFIWLSVSAVILSFLVSQYVLHYIPVLNMALFRTSTRSNEKSRH